MKNYDIKNIAELGTKKISEKGKRIAYLVPNMFLRINGGFNKLMAPYAGVVEESKAQAIEARDVANDNKAQAIEEKREAQIDQYDALRGNTAPTAVIKKYVLAKSIKHLENKVYKSLEAPRRLLISTVFLGKLIANTSKRYEEIEEAKEEVNEQVTTNYGDPVDYYFELQDKLRAKEAEVQELKEQMVSFVKTSGITREMVEERKKSRTK